MANPSNKLATKRLIKTLKPFGIVLQKIMTDGEKVIHKLSKFIIGWEI
jgi:hypothetical protein